MSITVTQEWAVETCCKCKVQFAVTAGAQGRWKDSGETFYCPNGHGQCYRETPAAREKKARQKAEAELAKKNTRVEELEGRLEAMKGTLAAERAWKKRYKKQTGGKTEIGEALNGV